MDDLEMEEESSASGMTGDREWDTMKRQFSTVGYREGLEVGREGALQEGFDIGFSEGIEYGLHFGKQLGIISTLDQVMDKMAQKDGVSMAGVREAVVECNKKVQGLAGQWSLQIEEEQNYIAEEAIGALVEHLAPLSFSEMENELAVEALCALITSSSKKAVGRYLETCCWDLFPVLVSRVAKKHNNSLHYEKVLMLMASECNPKEVFLLVEQSFEKDMENNTACMLLSLASKALARCPPQSVRKLIDSSLPVLLRALPDWGQSADNYVEHESSIATVQVHDTASEQSYHPIESESVTTIVAALIQLIESPLNWSTASEGDMINHKIIQFFFELMSRMSMCSLSELNLQHSRKIVDMVASTGFSVSKILKSTIEGFVNEDESLSIQGISYFVYILFIHHSQKLPSVLSPEYRLQVALHNSLHLLSNSHSSSKAVELIQHSVARISPSSVETQAGKTNIFFVFIQSLIDWMVKCPVQEARTHGYQVMKDLLGVLDDQSRFNILKQSTMACPYVSAAGLLLYQIKQETERNWPASNALARSAFVSHEVLLLLVEFHSTTDILEKIELLTTLLSFYRFLLIRDKATNFTGIWDQEQLAIVLRFLLETEERVLKLLQDSNKDLPSQKATQEYISEQYGLPKISTEDFQQIKLQTDTSLQLLLDLIMRVKELCSGATPFVGKPI